MSSPTVVPTTSTESVPASRRWLARAAFAAFLAAIIVIVASEGRTGLTLSVVGLVGAIFVLAGGYWFIARRGVVRWTGLALVIVAIVAVVLVFFRQGVVLIACIALGFFSVRKARRWDAVALPA